MSSVSHSSPDFIPYGYANGIPLKTSTTFLHSGAGAQTGSATKGVTAPTTALQAFWYCGDAPPALMAG